MPNLEIDSFLKIAYENNDFHSARDFLIGILKSREIDRRLRIKATHKLIDIHLELLDCEAATACLEKLFKLESHNYGNHYIASQMWMEEDAARAMDFILEPLQKIESIPKKYRGYIYSAASSAHSAMNQLGPAYKFYLQLCEYGPYYKCLDTAGHLLTHGYKVKSIKMNLIYAWQKHIKKNENRHHIKICKDRLDDLLLNY